MAISIHALLAESDFNGIQQRHALLDFYPRSPCGERPGKGTTPRRKGNISIHALLAESDARVCHSGLWYLQFLSTLSLRRATAAYCLMVSALSLFLSTLSLRRATMAALICEPALVIFLSTLSLRRATPGQAALVHGGGISIHALPAESD